MSGLTWSQSNGKYIQLTAKDREVASIIWLSTVLESDNTVVLKAKFFASFPIDESLITLLVNGSKEGAKAEISSLFGNAEYEYTYERSVKLSAGMGQYQLVLQGPKKEYTSSVFQVKDRKIQVLSDDDLFSRIIWVFPDPAKTNGHQTRLENSLLNYKAIVNDKISNV